MERGNRRMDVPWLTWNHKHKRRNHRQEDEVMMVFFENSNLAADVEFLLPSFKFSIFLFLYQTLRSSFLPNIIFFFICSPSSWSLFNNFNIMKYLGRWWHNRNPDDEIFGVSDPKMIIYSFFSWFFLKVMRDTMIIKIFRDVFPFLLLLFPFRLMLSWRVENDGNR